MRCLLEGFSSRTRSPCFTLLLLLLLLLLLPLRDLTYKTLCQGPVCSHMSHAQNHCSTCTDCTDIAPSHSATTEEYAPMSFPRKGICQVCFHPRSVLCRRVRNEIALPWSGRTQSPFLGHGSVRYCARRESSPAWPSPGVLPHLSTCYWLADL